MEREGRRRELRMITGIARTGGGPESNRRASSSALLWSRAEQSEREQAVSRSGDATRHLVGNSSRGCLLLNDKFEPLAWSPVSDPDHLVGPFIHSHLLKGGHWDVLNNRFIARHEFQ